ncbi:putative ribonuclease H-like domain-containing protein [Tanacetum coccineum]
MNAEIRIYDKSSEGIFEQASYDDDGVITDFHNLPDEVDVLTNPTLRIHNAHPQSQILGDPNTPVQTRSSLKKITEPHALVSYNSKLTKEAIHKDHHKPCLFCLLSYLSLAPRKRTEALSGRWEAGLKLCKENKNSAVQASTSMGFGDFPLVQGDRNKKDIMLVQVYVDDIIFGSTNKSWCAEFEALMQSRFQMSSMGELTFFLGLQVKQNNEGIFISQDKRGSFDVGNSKTSHLNACRRDFFKYLKGKPNLGLWYPRDSPLDLEAFSDSDYGGSNLDRKSTTGGCQFLGQRLISWQCKKQTIVATSTTEAEYVAAAHCCGQVLWVQNQLLDYGFNFMNTKIHIDNESTICIVEEPCLSFQDQYIEIRHHFIRDCYEKKLISVLLGVEKSDARSTWAWKRKCQVSLANWMQFGLDFLRRSKLRYALTHNPPIYDSLIKQFWQTATARTLADGTQQLNATIDTIEHTITEESVRRQLQLADASGIHMLQNEEIFEGLQNIGSKSGGWDQFGSNIAIALIPHVENRLAHLGLVLRITLIRSGICPSTMRVEMVIS